MAKAGRRTDAGVRRIGMKCGVCISVVVATVSFKCEIAIWSKVPVFSCLPFEITPFNLFLFLKLIA